MNTRLPRMDIESIYRALDELVSEIRATQISAEVARREEDEESLRWFEKKLAVLYERLRAIQYLAEVLGDQV